MDQVVTIVGLVMGIPMIGTVWIVWMRTRLKHRDLKLKEERLAAEERLRTDELNANLFKMDALGMSPAEIASLAENVRQLREEVAQLRQEINNRTHT